MSCSPELLFEDTFQHILTFLSVESEPELSYHLPHRYEVPNQISSGLQINLQ